LLQLCNNCWRRRVNRCFLHKLCSLVDIVTAKPVAALAILKMLHHSAGWYKHALENMLVFDDEMQKNVTALISEYNDEAIKILNSVAKIVQTENQPVLSLSLRQ